MDLTVPQYEDVLYIYLSKQPWDLNPAKQDPFGLLQPNSSWLSPRSLFHYFSVEGTKTQFKEAKKDVLGKLYRTLVQEILSTKIINFRSFHHVCNCRCIICQKVCDQLFVLFKDGQELEKTGKTVIGSNLHEGHSRYYNCFSKEKKEKEKIEDTQFLPGD